MKRIAVFAAAYAVIALSVPAHKAFAAGDKLPRPMVDANVEHLVPVELASRIALHRAKEVWGEQLCADDPVLCADEHGSLVAYLFTFRLGCKDFPSYDQIVKMVQDARDEERRIANTPLEDFAPKPPESGETQQPSEGSPKPFGLVPSIRPDGQTSHLQLAVRKRDKLEAAIRRRSGVGLFASIFISASFDLPPIPLMCDHLSPLYCNLDLATQNAQHAAPAAQVEFQRYYFLGHRGQYFGLLAGDEEVLVDAFSGEPVISLAPPRAKAAADPPDLLTDAGERAASFRASVAEQWDQLTHAVEWTIE